MMATIATAFSTEQINVAQPPVQIAQLASVRASDIPWLYSALTQVREIEESSANIPGLGDLRIAEATATRARMLLALIDVRELPTPLVSPVSGGGMSIQWAMGAKEVKYAFYPDGATMFFQVEDDEITDDGPLQMTEPDEVSEPLKWMLDARF